MKTDVSKGLKYEGKGLTTLRSQRLMNLDKKVITKLKNKIWVILDRKGLTQLESNRVTLENNINI